MGQSFEETVQNKPGLLFPAEGPPLEQIMAQAVDISLAFMLPAGAAGIFPLLRLFAHF